MQSPADNSNSTVIEYVIVIYAQGTVTTIMGFADMATAQAALQESAKKYSADWGYLYQANGQMLGHHP